MIEPQGQSWSESTGRWKGIGLLATTICIMCLGMINLYSASSGGVYFDVQFQRLAVTFVAMLVIGFAVPLGFWRYIAYPLFVLCLILLVVVLFTGTRAGGSQRWISLGPIAGQPSELAKIAIALVVARFASQMQFSVDHPVRLRDLWPILTAMGLTFMLIFQQPDLGTAGVCLLVGCAQLSFVRIHLRSLLMVGLSGVIAGAGGWFFFLKPYQKMRIMTLFNPELDPSGSGYNSLQSLVAIGSGGWFGKGFMSGSQTQLQFLPARHTDFIFSVFAEEHGFFGGIFVLMLFGLLIYLSLEIARRSRDIFAALVAIGCAGILFLQVIINLAMVLALFPVVGLPLPFFSYGGSSLLTSGVVVGLLLAVDRFNRRQTQNSRRSDFVSLHSST